MAAVGLRPPSAARAQSHVRTIGLIGSATASSQAAWVAAFVGRLRELGWIEGRNIRIEQHWAEGHRERHAEFAAELVGLNVDVIFAMGTEAALAAKEATQTIPIVFPVAGDPVGNGIVASLARPGGNVTGLSNLAADLAAKRIELARDIVPGLRRMAIRSMPRAPTPFWKCRDSKRRAAAVAAWETQPCSKSGAPRTSPRPCSRFRAAPTRFTSLATRS